MDNEKEKRRAKLMERLTQRNDALKNKFNESSSKSDAHEVDLLIEKARKSLDDGQFDDNVIQKLEEFVVLSVANRRTKDVQDILEDIRKKRFEQKNGGTKKTFSFAKKLPPKPRVEESKEETEAAVPSVSAIATDNIVENLSNQDRLISGQDGEDISIKNVSNCRIEVNFNPSAIHIRNVKDSAFVFLPCDRSILMHDCHNLTMFASAQQIRVHTSTHLTLRVAVRGAVILEECTGVTMGPYIVETENGIVKVDDKEEWRRVKDFDWLSEAQSPNWSIAEPEDWGCETFRLNKY